MGEEIPLQTLSTPRAGLLHMLSTWLAISVQSFGGGASTFYLIHDACKRQGWLSEEEFVQTWALVQISPGINLVKLAVMIGFRLRRWPGVIVALTGLLLPSALVTVLMTAGFTVIRSQPVVRAALRGLLPATIGLSLAMAVQMARPLMAFAQRQGRLTLAAHAGMIAASGLLLAAAGLNPAWILLLAGAGTVLLARTLGTRAWVREAGP